MSDETITPPTPADETAVQARLRQKRHDEFVAALAFIIVAAYLAFLATDVKVDETLRAVFLLVVGYWFGSSSGSKAKDKPTQP